MKIACIQTDQNIAKEKNNCTDLEFQINFTFETNLYWNQKQQDQNKNEMDHIPNNFYIIIWMEHRKLFPSPKNLEQKSVDFLDRGWIFLYCLKII